MIILENASILDGSLDQALPAMSVIIEGRTIRDVTDRPVKLKGGTRLDLMTEILTEAAQHMQVILLTCRERAFRHMTGTRLVL